MIMVIHFSESSAEIIKQVLQNDLNNVEKWLASYRLVLSQNKTKWMLFGNKQKLEHCSEYRVQLLGKKVERVSSVCYTR